MSKKEVTFNQTSQKSLENAQKHEKWKHGTNGMTYIKRKLTSKKSEPGWRRDHYKSLCLKKIKELKITLPISKLTTKQLCGLNGQLNKCLRN